ncbi:hypothetical protein DPX16_19960 [Anabarilius grahami]|uniref:Uncharacterized protein n=1 Tax=Anabarilius grahami TaxID=495550 RepID=A0A3N0Z1C4_ANAGA|nr:hypothetical protein DPX16_19960 [Anabarilius grahami]
MAAVRGQVRLRQSLLPSVGKLFTPRRHSTTRQTPIKHVQSGENQLRPTPTDANRRQQGYHTEPTNSNRRWKRKKTANLKMTTRGRGGPQRITRAHLILLSKGEEDTVEAQAGDLELEAGATEEAVIDLFPVRNVQDTETEPVVRPKTGKVSTPRGPEDVKDQVMMVRAIVEEEDESDMEPVRSLLKDPECYSNLNNQQQQQLTVANECHLTPV